MNAIYEAIEENNPQLKEKRETFLNDLAKTIANKKCDERHDYLSSVVNMVVNYPSLNGGACAPHKAKLP